MSNVIVVAFGGVLDVVVCLLQPVIGQYPPSLDRLSTAWDQVASRDQGR
jgi:hypothetical protein